MAHTEPADALAHMSDKQFLEHTLGILSREIGPYGLARFQRTFHRGSGDYTAERHQWLKGTTVEDLTRELEQFRGNVSKSSRQK